MKIYAKLNSENIVENVVVADEETINSFPDKEMYKLGEYPPVAKKPRADMGDLYLPDLDVFVDPKPFPSWILDENYEWMPPEPFPVIAGEYEWDEMNKTWRLSNDS